MTVEIYSDIACPWCYVGERRLARALAAFPHADRVEVVFRPYQLDPTLPETPRPLTESLRKKFGPRLDATLRQTAATARQDGLDLRFEDALAVNTLTAHRLLRFALEHGGPDVQRALAERLFEAHFTRGLNVADHDVLADLAEAAGLDRDDALAYLGVGDGEDEVRAEIAEAERLGIRAVPTFVFGGRTAVQGAQPASTFLQVLEELIPEEIDLAREEIDLAREEVELVPEEVGQEPAEASAGSCGDGACAPREQPARAGAAREGRRGSPSPVGGRPAVTPRGEGALQQSTPSGVEALGGGARWSPPCPLGPRPRTPRSPP